MVLISDLNKPIGGSLSDLGFKNPYSLISCLVLKLYTIEFGTPSLYEEANRAARDMDETHLKNLGPFLNALSHVISFAESERPPIDKILTGKMINPTVENNMGGAFVLWRGT